MNEESIKLFIKIRKDAIGKLLKDAIKSFKQEDYERLRSFISSIYENVIEILLLQKELELIKKYQKHL